MEIINDFDSEEETLITQIENEMRKIFVSVEKLYNNASLEEATEPLEKCLISNYCYSDCLMKNGVEDGLDRNEDILKSFEESLQNEIDCLTSDMDALITKMNAYKDQLSNIDRNITNLNEMMKAQKNEGKTKSDKKLDSEMKNIKLRFRKEKSDLKAIVSSLFPDNIEIQDLIAMIVDHHFTEGTDKYMQLENTDSVSEQIELLRRTCLFETNPHDPLQIRLTNLV